MFLDFLSALPFLTSRAALEARSRRTSSWDSTFLGACLCKLLVLIAVRLFELLNTECRELPSAHTIFLLSPRTQLLCDSIVQWHFEHIAKAVQLVLVAQKLVQRSHHHEDVDRFSGWTPTLCYRKARHERLRLILQPLRIFRGFEIR